MKKISWFCSLVFLCLCIFCTNTDLNAQTNCPTDTGYHCSQWVSSNYTTSTDRPECTLKVVYRYRICDGVYQIYIDDMQKTGNCEFMGDQPSSSSFQEWVNLLLIEEISGLSGMASVPTCPESGKKAIFYTASCGMWVKCDYIVDPAKRECDKDWRGAYPDYGSSGVSKVSVWKWQPCGYTCCKKTYTICKSFDEKTGKFFIHIYAISKEKVGECSNPDGLIGPCHDGCED